MIEKYLIAGFVLELSYKGDPVIKTKLSPYIADEFSSTDIKISISYSSQSIPVKTDTVTKVSDNGYFYSQDGEDILFYYDENISKVIAKIIFSKGYKDVNIILYELKMNHNVEDSQLAYNVLGTAFNYVIQPRNSFVLHSSAVCCDGGGVAFSAMSGTGKSTHTSLWLQQFDGSFILNDDTPVIHMSNDKCFYISGSPWAGTTGINANVSVPLKAIVFLERGIDNSIEPIPPSDAVKLLFEGIRLPFNVSILTNLIDTFNTLLSSVPVYRLKCNMDKSAAVLSKTHIYN